jgi:uncharacterized protein YpmB
MFQIRIMLYVIIIIVIITRIIIEKKLTFKQTMKPVGQGHSQTLK